MAKPRPLTDVQLVAALRRQAHKDTVDASTRRYLTLAADRLGHHITRKGTTK